MARTPDMTPERLEHNAPHWIDGNHVELLRGGDALFPAMLAAIRNAQRDVWLATYIFQLDEAGRPLCQALVEAAQRGVRVRVVVDGFGSRDTVAALRQHLTPAGVHIAAFRPLEQWWHWLRPTVLRRLHLKLCSVDDQQAFVGGINVLDDRRNIGHPPSALPRLDLAVRLRGPVVMAVVSAQRDVWARVLRWHRWRERVRAGLRHPWLGGARQRMSARHPASFPGLAPVCGTVTVALVVRDNRRHRHAIEQCHLTALAQARSHVDLVTPYFYPGRHFRQALVDAARRGVRVRLLLQGKPDYWLAGLAARVLYDELLAAGIEIHEYTAAFLHAKAARVDDTWATVGSSNIDPLSLLLNLEANVVVRDAAFNQALGREFERALTAARRITTPPLKSGWPAWLGRTVVAWAARTYLRLAGLRHPY